MTNPIAWWMWGSDAVIIVGAYILGRMHGALIYRSVLNGFLEDVATLRDTIREMRMMRDWQMDDED